MAAARIDTSGPSETVSASFTLSLLSSIHEITPTMKMAQGSERLVTAERAYWGLARTAQGDSISGMRCASSYPEVVESQRRTVGSWANWDDTREVARNRNRHVRRHGAPGRIRTFGLALRRRALYPLSYEGNGCRV